MGSALRAIHSRPPGGLHVPWSTAVCFAVRVFLVPSSSSSRSLPFDHLSVSSSCSSSSCYAHAWASPEMHPITVSARWQRRTLITRASNWASQQSPYETLELERDADEEKIKAAYRRLAKYYHPDVYDGRGTLEEGETAEARFIKIQAAYELLIDEEKKQEYDKEHHVNPMKASHAWMEWLMKKRKAFDQRGDMAIAAWAEQQQREMYIRARNLSRSKIDPEEERKLRAKEMKISIENANSTLKRHTLVLRKRDLMRRKAAGDQKTFIRQLLAAEGLELDLSDDENDKTN